MFLVFIVAAMVWKLFASGKRYARCHMKNSLGTVPGQGESPEGEQLQRDHLSR